MGNARVRLIGPQQRTPGMILGRLSASAPDEMGVRMTRTDHNGQPWEQPYAP